MEVVDFTGVGTVIDMERWLQKNGFKLWTIFNPARAEQLFLIEKWDMEERFSATAPLDEQKVTMMMKEAVLRLEEKRHESQKSKLIESVSISEINEYQRLAARTMNEDLSRNKQWMHALHGMAGEIGELHSIYQKEYQGHEFDSSHAKKELGDLMWFIAEYCTAHGWTLQEICEMNIKKLMDRYPNGFEAEKSLHRAEGDV